MLEAAKKAGAAGELLSQRDLQAIFNNALNPPKEPQPQKVSVWLGFCLRVRGVRGVVWVWA